MINFIDKFVLHTCSFSIAIEITFSFLMNKHVSHVDIKYCLTIGNYRYEDRGILKCYVVRKKETKIKLRDRFAIALFSLREILATVVRIVTDTLRARDCRIFAKSFHRYDIHNIISLRQARASQIVLYALSTVYECLVKCNTCNERELFSTLNQHENDNYTNFTWV